MKRLVLNFWAVIFFFVLKIVRSTIGIATSRLVWDVLWVLYCMATYFLLASQQIFVFHIRSKLSPDNKSNSSKSLSNFMQFFFCIHCFFFVFFHVRSVCFFSFFVLSPWVVVPKNKMGDDEVDNGYGNDYSAVFPAYFL